jgi:hypothetical protein
LREEIERLIKKLELDKQILETKYLPTLTMMTRPPSDAAYSRKIGVQRRFPIRSFLTGDRFGHPYG